MSNDEVGGAGRAPADTAAPSRRRHWMPWTIAAAVVLVLAGVVAAWMLWPPAAAVSAPAPTRSATDTAVATPTPSPTPTSSGFAVNTTVYALEGLPEINVFTVLATLPVDDDPFGGFTGSAARALGVGAPVFADPVGQPVAYLPHDYTYGGTTVPIVEQQDNWVKVLLVGREAVPSQGNPAQVTGWLRTADIETVPVDAVVEVSISDRTVDIIRGGSVERIAADFGWGVDQSPTPLGRSFVMTIRTEPTFEYTRGHPLVYLSVQSPTLDGFGGADAAVTAFHYHDDRSGAVSNGCLRMDPDAITQLGALPVGTPVVIRP